MTDETAPQPGSKRSLAVVGIIVLVLAAGIAAVPGLRGCGAKDTGKAGGGTVKPPEGERHHGWTAFYHAREGTWRFLESAGFVLREQKFVSGPAERDAYTRIRLQKNDALRTLHAAGRWKFVQVLRDRKTLGYGWIDADPVRRIETVKDDFSLAARLGPERAAVLFKRTAPLKVTCPENDPTRLRNVAMLLTLFGVPVKIDPSVPDDIRRKTITGEWNRHCLAEIITDMSMHYGLTWRVDEGAICLYVP